MPMFHRAAPTFEAIEFRAEANGGDTFVGYAAVFNSPSKPIFDPKESRTEFIETIAPGAFTGTIAEARSNGSRKTFVVDHDDRLFISATDGALKLGEDSRGLIVESPWPKTDYAMNVRALADSGAPLGMSFSFRPTKNGQEWSNGGRARRLTNVVLGHATVLASLVPAYNETEAAFRALAFRTETDMEDLDNLFAAIKEGRDLTDDEKTLLRKVANDVDPITPVTEEPRSEYDAVALEAAKAKLAAILD